MNAPPQARPHHCPASEPPAHQARATRGRDSDFALSPRSGFRLRITGPAPKVRQRVLLTDCFFHHSHAQSWHGRRIAPCFPENAGSAVLYSTTPPDLPPGLPGNSGSALLYSRTLTENSGCDAVNMAFLPESPPGLSGKHRQCVGTQRCTPGVAARFPASNLASYAKEMGKIKLFPTTEHSSKQPSDPVVPLVPCTGSSSGHQNRAKPWL